jgi:putative transposase
MYRWRKVTSKEQQEMLAWRKEREFPWHRPPHRVKGDGCFHVTAACYEHAPFVGTSLVRMKAFSEALLEHLRTVTSAVHSWCVLPNHYHLLVEVTNLKDCLKSEW